MFNEVQGVNEVLLSCFPNKDVVAVNFLNWCEDKVRHIVAMLLEVLSNRQAGTLVAGPHINDLCSITFLYKRHIFCSFENGSQFHISYLNSVHRMAFRVHYQA